LIADLARALARQAAAELFQETSMRAAGEGEQKS
jgi:hypothetical protein